MTSSWPSRWNLLWLLWLGFVVAVIIASTQSPLDAASTSRNPLPGALWAIAGILLASAINLQSKLMEEYQATIDLSSALLTELYYRSDGILRAPDFCRNQKPNEFLVSDQFQVLLRGEPILLGEFAKRMSSLPIAARYPLVALLDNLKSIEIFVKSLPTERDLKPHNENPRVYPMVPNGAPDWKLQNFKADLKSAACNLSAAIGALETIGQSGARSDHAIRNSEIREKLNNDCQTQ